MVPNHLQLPVNQAKNSQVRTNQRDGLMTYFVDGAGENPHVNAGAVAGDGSSGATTGLRETAPLS